MKHRVEVAQTAKRNVAEAFEWLRERSPAHATRWFNGLAEAVAGLEVMPKRWGLARESRHFDEEIRQALYGKRGGVYRILFVVRGDVVHVIHIRHAARLELSPDEVRLPEEGGGQADSSSAGEAP
jgi:plasmid stabilization system protein ParE